MTYKTPLIIVSVLLIIAIGVIAYLHFTKPDTTELRRDTQLQSQIDKAIESLIVKDSLLALYEDSLRTLRNAKHEIIKVVYKEQQQIISEPLTDSRIIALKKYFSDFYESKAGEVGITAPPLEDRKVELTLKESKGGELLISDYNGVKAINNQLITENDLLTKSSDLKQQKITALNDIVALKEKQIVKLEKTKVPIVSSRKWYVDFGIISGSLAVGAIIGIVYANNR